MGLLRHKQYKAFISYSHQNEKFSQWLHNSLERYRVPKELTYNYPNLPKRLYPIFRDREELPSSSNLGVNILNALKNSDYLIVVCSMESAKSFWVNQEIIDFKTLHGEDKVLAIILDGEPNAKDKENFDDGLECFPLALKYRVKNGVLSDERTEPIAADVREGKDGYKFGKLKLIAGLLGIGLEELYRREEKRQKRSRILWSTGLLFVLTLVSLLAFYGFWQKEIAQKETLKVEKQLYNNFLQQGLLYRDHLDAPVKSKWFFAEALAKTRNAQDYKNSQILYNSTSETNNVLANIFEHNDTINGAIFTKDEKKVLSWSKDGILKLWNIEGEIPLQTFHHDKAVLGAVFSKNEQYILSWSEDHTARLWSIKSPIALNVFKHEKPVNGARFTKDEQDILSWGDDFSLKLWDRELSSPLKVWKQQNHIWGAIFTKDEQRILSWGRGKLYLWERNSSKPLQIFQNQEFIYGAIFTKDEEHILSWSGDTTVKLWTPKSPIALKSFKHQYYATGAMFNREETEILSWSNDRKLKIWDINNSKPKKIFKHNMSLFGASYSKNEQKILAYDGTGAIKVWNINNSFNPLKTFKHKGYVFHAMWNKNEEYIVSCGQDKTVKLWALHTVKPLQVFKHNNIVRRAIFSKEENYLLSWGKGNILKLWNMKDTIKTKKFHYGGYITKVEFTQNKQLMLVWGEKNIYLWDINSSEPLNVFKHDEAVVGVSVLKDGQHFISWSYDDTVKLWNLESNIPLKIFKGKAIRGISISPNEKYILCWGFKNQLILLETSTLRVVHEFKVQGFIKDAVFSLDGNYILFWDKHLNLLDIKSNKVIKTSTNYVRHATKRISFDFVGQDTIVSINENNRFEMWDIQGSNIISMKLLNNRTGSRGKKYIEWKDNSIELKDKYTLELRGEEGNLLQTFQDINKFKNAIFTPNEQYVLSWNKEEIKLWSPKSKVPLRVFKLNGTVYDVLVSEDGKYLMAWNKNVVKLWDINSPKALHIFRNDKNIDKAYFMKDMQKILIVLRDGNIKIHSLFTALDAKLTAQDYLLKTEVETGTSLLPSGELKVLSSKEWREKKERFELLLLK